MLKGIPSLIGPDLLHVLHSMGHGDELVVADANFPGAGLGPRLIRMDGHSLPDVIDAVLTLLPLDDFEHAAFRMEVDDNPAQKEPVMIEIERIVARHEPNVSVLRIDHPAFFARSRHAFAIVQTGETRFYGNIILRKGVIRSRT
jgi:L-fucose mutarotase